METKQQNSDSIDENQSLKVIREMIAISRNNFSNDGLLLILWGWIFFVATLVRFLLKVLVITHEISSIANKSLLLLLLVGLVITGDYLYKRRQVVRTYSGQILRYLWGAIIFLNLYILFFQLKANMDIDWLFSQYMLFIALGTFVTAGIIKFKPLIYSSISLIILVQVSLIFHAELRILIASLSFVTGLIIPGHLLYSKRKRS